MSSTVLPIRCSEVESLYLLLAGARRECGVQSVQVFAKAVLSCCQLVFLQLVNPNCCLYIYKQIQQQKVQIITFYNLIMKVPILVINLELSLTNNHEELFILNKYDIHQNIIVGYVCIITNLDRQFYYIPLKCYIDVEYNNSILIVNFLSLLVNLDVYTIP